MLENLDRFRTTSANVCKVATIIQELEPNDRQILEAALADRERWTTNALYKGLKELGVHVGQTQLYRHRDNICKCGGASA